jgi:dipeptidyl aminopeptidase/acylaminoacyl peptidase
MPFPTELVAARAGQRAAWVLFERGVRNVWGAEGPAWTPHRLTAFQDDDGQELTQLAFTPDGRSVVFVRGGDHGSNWPSPGGIEPNPGSSLTKARIELWIVPWAGGAARMLTAGDQPAVSPRGGEIAFIKDGQVSSIGLGPKPKPAELFFARGTNGGLAWSPDGRTLAFVCDRGDYGLVGLYRGHAEPIRWLAPNTDRVGSLKWSPDGKRIAFVSQPGRGGAPPKMLELRPDPWSIRVVDVETGVARTVWDSPKTILGSLPYTQGSANLDWGAGDRLVFVANLDGWPHLYSVAATGGEPLLLTPGKFMVEFVSLSPDRRTLVYNANTGPHPNDDDRRHLFRVAVDAAAPVELTRGTDLEWSPAVTGDGRTVLLLTSGPTRPPLPAIVSIDGGSPRLLGADRVPKEFPAPGSLVTPERVVIPSLDGTPVHLQVFNPAAGGSDRRPALVYVHGGPPRQMLLGFHYWFYYASDYALNQYFASRGIVVASVNYRLGIGYGDQFMNAEHAGPAGASEYLDVQAAARYLAGRPDVDPRRIGIWGGSYGGFLTALALARNSDLFSAGVDLHGVHDWIADADLKDLATRYEKPTDLTQALEVAWKSSPIADIATWRSPVLLIHGDDDRNVKIGQTVDLVQRLRAQNVRFEELLLPDEIHDFLRYATWRRVGEAATSFFEREFKLK